MKNPLVAFTRPRCRIPLGEPDENGRVWSKVPRLPAPKRGPQATAYDFRTPPTAVRALAGAEALYVRFDCPLDDPQRLAPRTPGAPLGEIEHAYVVIYPTADPTDAFRFDADHKGMHSVTRLRQMTGERSLGGVPDRWSSSTPAPVEWSRYHGMSARSWFVELVIPWASIGLAARPAVIGFEYGRVYTTGRVAQPIDDSGWPGARPRPALGHALEMPEALLGPDTGAPAQVEFAPLRYGKNRARLLTGGDWPARADRLRVRTELADGTPVAAQDYPVRPKAAAVEFDFYLDRAFCSHLEIFNAPRLVIEAVRARTGEALYTGRLPMDRHLGACVDEPYGEAGALETTPGVAPTRRDRTLDRITRALPRLERRHTGQGAPSDFCLTGADGQVVANLMADDAWERLAAVIEDRFQTPEDRLVAAMALVGQKSVTNLFLCHMFFNVAGDAIYHSSMQEKMGPLSIMRYGGGPGVPRAVVLARLIRQLRHPATGRPLAAARVLFLTRDGGPKRATRHEPFGQKPAPVGAVAVDYGDGQTLLDPSNLAFFPKADGRLATIEEVLADEALRRDGAGRLAPLYARLDLDEVRHEPPNRRLTNGVFPELAPDEDRPDRPFDPRERQVIRTLVAPEGREAALDGFRDVDGRPGTRDGAVRVRWTSAGLRVHVQVRGARLDALAGRDAQAEQVHVTLDTGHGHTHYAHFMAAAGGERKFWRDETSYIQTLFKHQCTDNSMGSADLADPDWSARIEPTGEGYAAVFDLSWKTLQLRARPPVLGLNVRIEGRAPVYEQLFLAPPRFRLAGDPFTFADLYLGDSPVTIEEIDLGIPTYTANTGRATVRNRTARPVALTLQAENRLAMRRCVTRSKPVPVRLKAREVKAVEFPFYVNPEEKMGGPQKIRLVARQGTVEHFRAIWGNTYCGPVSAYERYGRAIGPARNPKPGARDFMLRKNRHLCSRIPQFQRLTTRDGAPSDFFLRAEDGSAEFNLMKPGVLQEVADYIAARFDNDLDRILGLWMLSQAPFFTRHMSWGHRIMEGADPLSLLRGNFAGGGGNCGYHSRAFGGLACHLKLGGRYLNAHGSVSLWGHVISAVGQRGSKAIIDADVGHVFLTRDGRRLATLEEMRANPDVLTTAGPGELGRYYTVSDASTRARRSLLGEAWLGTFPPHSPTA